MSMLRDRKDGFTIPLDLPDVLEDEFVAMGGELRPSPDNPITPADVLDVNAACSSIGVGFEGLVDRLEQLRTNTVQDDRSNATRLPGCEKKLRPVTRRLVEGYRDADENVKRLINRRILEDVSGDALRRSHALPIITADQIIDIDSARATAQPYGLCDNRDEKSPDRSEAEALARKLESLRVIVNESQAGCPAVLFRNCTRLDPNTLLLIDHYSQLGKNGQRAAVNRLIIDQVFGEAIAHYRDIRLAELYAQLHKRKVEDARTALCISGGGIRSATFGLGVLQGLARRGLLKHFDYLSTVSGGGYIGSWLSSWARRHPNGIHGVEQDLARTTWTAEETERPTQIDKGFVHASQPDTPPPPIPPSDRPKLEPEAAPIRHLRKYSNYLTPRVGILSGDTWAFAALYLRNLIINLIVLVPIIALALALPRALAWLVGFVEITKTSLIGSAFIADVSVLVLFWYLGAARPVGHGSDASATVRFLARMSARTRFVLFSGLPAAGLALGMTLFSAKWTWLRDRGALTPFDIRAAIAAAVIAVIFMTVVPWSVYAWRLRRERKVSLEPLGERPQRLKRMAREALAAVFALICGIVLSWFFAVKVFDESGKALPEIDGVSPFLLAAQSVISPRLVFIWIAPAVVAFILFLQATAFVAASGKWNEDYDREWWGRIGGWLLAGGVAWIVLAGISILGPLAIYRAPTIITALGGISGLVAITLGRSAKSKAMPEAGQGRSRSDKLLLVTVPLFSVFLLASISWLTTFIIQKVDETRRPPDRRIEAQLQSVVTAPVRSVPFSKGYRESLRTNPQQYASVEMLAAFAHLRTIEKTRPIELGLIFSIAFLAFLASVPVGANRFSMHSLYRNRLIRAYLGACRYDRNPDPITGFDRYDNLPMCWLRTERLWYSNFRNFDRFIDDLRKALLGLQPKVELSAKLAKLLLENTRKLLVDTADRERLEREVKSGKAESGQPNDAPDSQRDIGDVVLQDLNRILSVENLCGSVAQPASVDDRIRNRRCFDDAYRATGWVDAMPLLRRNERVKENQVSARPPLHIVNAALNLVSGASLEWQQRRAESFTVSPLHAGSAFLGYRDSREYGDDREGISLGTAVAISGAAASPNQGYHSSPALAFLMTLFNVRLGWWLGNPGVGGNKTYNAANPRNGVILLGREMISATDDEYEWVYLSDGGHFENLGIYEMVLRRCRFIVAIDSGCDPKCTFDDLGNVIRKVRTDFGIPITFGEMAMPTRDEDESGNYVALGTIHYDAVDGTCEDGTLVYIKPGYYRDDVSLPKDVVNYGKEWTDFPHQSTADQWFTESQFESYRMLGQHVIDQICGRPAEYKSVADFIAAVRGKVGPGAQRSAYVPVLAEQVRYSGTKGAWKAVVLPRSSPYIVGS